jgi:hypothetical protein
MQPSMATSETSRPMNRSYDSSAIASSSSITPASIHSSRLRRSVVAEHDLSEILS